MKAVRAGTLAGAVLAVSAIGFGLAAGQDISETELARAEIAEPFEAKTDGPSDYVVHRVRVEPGWSSGWHSHPGTVLVAVTAGELTLYEGDDPDCTPRRLKPGQGVAEPGGAVMLARNEAGAPLEAYVTYLVPAGDPLGSEEPRPGHCPSA